MIRQKLVSLDGSSFGITSKSLGVCFDVNADRDIDSWLQFAIKKKVKRLEFDFSRVLYDYWGNMDGQL